MFVLYLLMISPLWDRVYVDTIKADWQTSPLIDVKFINKDESCDTALGFDPQPLARAYWWGLMAGCNCVGSANVEAKREICTDEELKNYCKTTKYREPGWLDIINGKKVCGKRAKGYNFLHGMSNPKKYTQAKSGEGKPIECKNDTLKVCGNANTEVDIRQVWCIPKEEQCPLTKIELSDA